MAMTSDDLLTSVRRLAFLPDASDLTSADLLSMADEEVETLVADAIKAAREEHWVTYQDYTLSPSVLAYRLPRRALARMVRGVGLVSTAGIYYKIPQIDTVSGWDRNPTQGVTSSCYFFRDDYIVFPAPPPAGFTMRVHYLRRPSALVVVNSAAPVTLCTSTSVVRIASIPTWLQTWITAFEAELNPAPLYLDIVRGDAPFDLIYTDLALSAASDAGPDTVTFSNAPLTTTDFVDLTAISNDRQDYICLRDQTVYPQLPVELHPVLVAACVRRVLEALGDPRAAAAEATYQARRRAAMDLIEPRNEEGSKPIMNKVSPMRGGGLARRGRRWR